MSMFDRVRRGIAVGRKYLHPNRIVFHHAPRCGGTSVGRAIRKRFLLSQATVLPEATCRTEEILDPTAESPKLLARAWLDAILVSLQSPSNQGPQNLTS